MSELSKVALVTGGGSGIGRQTALTLLKAGYKVVVAGRRRELLEETLSLSGIPNESAIALTMDVTKPDSVKNTFSKLIEKFKRLDLLFNKFRVVSIKISTSSL